MKTYLAIAVVALQVFVLAYMAGEREWVLRTGRTIYLTTAPFSPRDAMRGDYLQLDYDVSLVPCHLLRDGLVRVDPRDNPLRPDTRVYASLRVNEDGLAELVSLSDRRPSGGLFIRGRSEPRWGGDALRVRYGIEAYFVGHAKAEEMEELHHRQGVQVPLEMAVAVAGDGLAVIKDYRWGDLGIGVNLEREKLVRRPERRMEGPVRAAEIRLTNVSGEDLAIVDLPGGRSLALATDPQGYEHTWRWMGENRPAPDVKAANVVVLKPGQKYTMRVDFKDPAWFVVEKSAKVRDAKPKSLAELDKEWSAVFRFEYRPPSREACKDLPNARLIWHGRLPSQVLSAKSVLY